MNHGQTLSYHADLASENISFRKYLKKFVSPNAFIFKAQKQLQLLALPTTKWVL